MLGICLKAKAFTRNTKYKKRNTLVEQAVKVCLKFDLLGPEFSDQEGSGFLFLCPDRVLGLLSG